jgi:membrane-associated protein
MLSLTALLPIIGYTGIAAIVFAESGLLIGFFLPGDSLLFTAGFLASQGVFHIIPLILISMVAAIAGDSVGYAFGHRVGRKIFKKEDSLLFHKDNLVRAEAFYDKHGGKALILARFMPVIRTFAPILAGVGTMKYSKFLVYNVIGGVLWAVGLPLLGYFLGSAIPDVDKYLLPIIVGIVLLSILPSIIHILKTKEDRERALDFLRQGWNRIFPK